MKTKLFFIVVVSMLMSTRLSASVQHLSLTEVQPGTTFYYCSLDVDSVIVHKPEGAGFSQFNHDDGLGWIEEDSIVVTIENQGFWVWDGGTMMSFYINFTTIAPTPDPFASEEIYKCPETSMVILGQAEHQPDFTYVWGGGETSPSIQLLIPGMVFVTVTGACGEVTDMMEVMNWPSPDPDLGADQFLCNGSTATLDPGDFAAYNWSTGENTQQITVSQTAEYSVTVTDANGCKNSDDVYVHFYENPGIEISTVSVDTVNGNNKIVWNTNIPDFYNNDVDIYRNGTTNELTKIATVPYMQGYFTDEENSSQRTWRYAITAKDNCENHSNISLYHESMKISLVGLIGNAVKVEWTPYTIEGDQTKSISSYKVFSVGGFGESWIASEIATIPGTQTSYNLPLTNDSLYVVGAILNNGGKNPGENMALAIMENPTVTRALLLEDVKFALYPNPSTGPVNVNGVGKLEIINSLGQIVLYDNINGETTISLPKGAYIMKLTNNNITHTKKFIIIE